MAINDLTHMNKRSIVGNRDRAAKKKALDKIREKIASGEASQACNWDLLFKDFEKLRPTKVTRVKKGKSQQVRIH